MCRGYGEWLRMKWDFFPPEESRGQRWDQIRTFPIDLLDQCVMSKPGGFNALVEGSWICVYAGVYSHVCSLDLVICCLCLRVFCGFGVIVEAL